MTTPDLSRVRSALFLPASNARAIEKVRSLPCDMVILDLEDAVKPADKDRARDAAVAAAKAGFGERIVAIRINGADTRWHEADLAAACGSHADILVLPKVEAANDLPYADKPWLAMIETPAGLLAATSIAAARGVAGLIAGTNDLAATLRLSGGSGRIGLALALQTIVLAGRAAGVSVFDGVYNRLDDPAGLATECAEGRAYGFDGKTLIHPGQIDVANRAFGPSDAEIAEAHALIAAATGGAERYEGRMIETMHVDAARRTVARAGGSAAASL